MASDTMVTLSSLIGDLRAKAKEQADDVVTQYINNNQLEKKVKNLWTTTDPNNDTGSSTINFTIPKDAYGNKDITDYMYAHIRSLGYQCSAVEEEDENGVKTYYIAIKIPFSELDPS